MDKKSKAFLFKYLNNCSPTGFETSGQQIWLDYMKAYSDDYISDAYGSVAAIINPGKKYKVVIEAHADEISWFVKYITDDGYLYVTRNGGSDHLIAPSMRVNILTSKGSVKGIFGWPAIHVRIGEKEVTPTTDNIFIDIGCSNKKEVEEMGVHVGCVAVFEDELMELNDKYLTGRALDNRIGGYMIAEVAKKLFTNKVKLPYSLYVVNAVQEEIGLRGAEMISRKIKPDVAVITDVTHDTSSPLYDKKKLIGTYTSETGKSTLIFNSFDYQVKKGESVTYPESKEYGYFYSQGKSCEEEKELIIDIKSDGYIGDKQKINFCLNNGSYSTYITKENGNVTVKPTNGDNGIPAKTSNSLESNIFKTSNICKIINF
jgi:putative aminopeptidase FrvX